VHAIKDEHNFTKINHAVYYPWQKTPCIDLESKRLMIVIALVKSQCCKHLFYILTSSLGSTHQYSKHMHCILHNNKFPVGNVYVHTHP